MSLNRSVVITTIISLGFLWSGLIIGLSFIEAPLKFQAPNITVVLGLGIGKLVFQTLNKIEIVIAGIIFFLLVVSKFETKYCIFFAFPIVLLLIQSIWLLPILDERVNLMIAGNSVKPSHHHYTFIACEVLKLIALLTASINFLYKHIQK